MRYLMATMKSIDDIRLGNLARLVDRFGGQALLADAVEINATQISQWLNRAPNSATGKPRVMHTRTVRRIEEALGIPPNCMDTAGGVDDYLTAIVVPESTRLRLPGDYQQLKSASGAAAAFLAVVTQSLAQSEPKLAAQIRKGLRELPPELRDHDLIKHFDAVLESPGLAANRKLK